MPTRKIKTQKDVAQTTPNSTPVVKKGRSRVTKSVNSTAPVRTINDFYPVAVKEDIPVSIEAQDELLKPVIDEDIKQNQQVDIPVVVEDDIKLKQEDDISDSVKEDMPVSIEAQDELLKPVIDEDIKQKQQVDIPVVKKVKGRPKKEIKPKAVQETVEEKFEIEEDEEENNDIEKIEFNGNVRILNLLITINAPIGVIILADKKIAEDVYELVSKERTNEYGILCFEECKGAKKGTDHIHLYLRLKAGSVLSKLSSQRISFAICDYFKIDKNNWNVAVDFKVIKKCQTAVGYVLKTIDDVFPDKNNKTKSLRHFVFGGNMEITKELKLEILRLKNEYRPNEGAKYNIKNIGSNPDEWIHGAYQWMKVKGYTLCMNTGKIVNKTAYYNNKYKESDFIEDITANYIEGNNKWTAKKQKEFFSYLYDRKVPYIKRPYMRANRHLIGFKDGLLYLEKGNVRFEKDEQWLDKLDKDWPCYMANEEFKPRFPSSVIELMGDHMGIETIWAMIHADRKILWFDNEHKFGSMQILYGHSNAGKTTITMPWEVVWGKFGLYYQLPNASGQFAYEALRDNPDCFLMCYPDSRMPTDEDALNTMKKIGDGSVFDLPVKGGTKIEIPGKACKMLVNSAKPPLNPNDVHHNAILMRSHVFELNAVEKKRFESEQAGKMAVVRDAVYYFLLLADLDNKYITYDMIPEKYKKNEKTIELSTKGYVNGAGLRLIVDKSSNDRYKKINEDFLKCKIGEDPFECDPEFENETDYSYIDPVD